MRPSIAILSVGDASDQHCLLKAFDENEPFAVRVMGAVGLAWTLRKDTPDDVRKFIGTLNEKNLQPVLALFSWDAGDPEDYFGTAARAIAGQSDQLQ